MGEKSPQAFYSGPSLNLVNVVYSCACVPLSPNLNSDDMNTSTFSDITNGLLKAHCVKSLSKNVIYYSLEFFLMDGGP